MSVDEALELPSWLTDRHTLDGIERDMRDAAEAFMAGRLGLMIGAGSSLPADVASSDELITAAFREVFPTLHTADGEPVDEAVKERIEELKAKHPFEVILSAVAEHLGPDPKRLESWLRSNLYPRPTKPKEAYGSLAKLIELGASEPGVGRLDRVFTTNFDRFIEDSLGGRGFPVTANTLDRLNRPDAPNEFHVVHFHGLVSEDEKRDGEQQGKGTFVATEETLFEGSLENSPMRWRLLEEMLASDVFAFVGYSMSDANLRAIYRQFRTILEQNVAKEDQVVLFVAPFKDQLSLDFAKEVAESRRARIIPVDAEHFFTSIDLRVRAALTDDLLEKVSQHKEYRPDELSVACEQLADILSVEPRDALDIFAYLPNSHGTYMDMETGS